MLAFASGHIENWYNTLQDRPIELQNITMHSCVCLYVFMSICLYCIAARSHISTTTRPNFMKFSVHVTLSHGSILRSEQWNTLCTSGFVDDVMFSDDGPYGV